MNLRVDIPSEKASRSGAINVQTIIGRDDGIVRIESPPSCGWICVGGDGNNVRGVAGVVKRILRESDV